jgi:excinuclease ABC subunit A
VIKTADWIIDLGPEGGDGGGKIVAEGTPEDVAKVKESYTGKYLKDLLTRRPLAPSGRLNAPGGRRDEGESPSANKRGNGKKAAAE